jgi:NitT/TauT family transport system permease protein
LPLSRRRRRSRRNGYLVTRYRTILDSAHVFAAILMILVLSILFDLLARAVERRTLVWQTAGRRDRPTSANRTTTLPAPAPV